MPAPDSVWRNTPASWRPRVFVYGTLRRGGANHHHLAPAQLLGTFTTPAAYTMYDLGPYPGVVPGGDTAICGEVYRITAALLRSLDRLEDYPRHYDRHRILTPWGAAWIYLLRRQPTRRPRLNGTWPHCDLSAPPKTDA
jgi:gamma-glutamylcyclotransferase (GGCT)/AIG2-like uncharacterized protein YtfP